MRSRDMYSYTRTRLLRIRKSRRIRCIVPRFRQIIFSSLLSKKPYRDKIFNTCTYTLSTYSQYSIRETNLFIFL